MQARFGFGEAFFSLKCFVAAMLAYYLALEIGLTRPFWAVMTSYIVAHPLAGAVLSKAVYRVVGTIVGAVVAVALVPVLVNAPELLSLALAVWLGVCVYVALLDRTPRAYVFLLAGYTASIIGFPSVSAPDQIFLTAILRVQEICLGIACAGFVHGVLFPKTVVAQMLIRIGTILKDGERWTRDSLALAPEATLAQERRRLALDISDLHQLSIHVPFDTARLVPRTRAIRAIQDQLSMLLPLATAVEDRLEVLASHDAIPQEVQILVDDVRLWVSQLATVKQRTDAPDVLIARARALEPDLDGGADFSAMVQLSLLARLAELIRAHRNCRDLDQQIRLPTRTAITPDVAALLAISSRRPLHLDRAMALRAAAGTVATMLFTCIFWIATGWHDGAGAALIAGVVCALFCAADEPAPFIRTFLYGTATGLFFAAIYNFAIFPRITAFPILALSLAPILLVAGMLMTRPQTALLATGATLGFLGTISLSDHYDAQFVTFINGGIAQLVGAGIAVICVQLFLTVGSAESGRRIIRAGWSDLATRSNSFAPPDVKAWFSRMLDRIGLLAPRLAALQEDPGQPLFDTLIDLRVGAAVAELRELRSKLGAASGGLLTLILQGVGNHYSERLDGNISPPPAALLDTVDEALIMVAQHEDPLVRRAGVLALISLRRNLFSQSLSMGQGA